MIPLNKKLKGFLQCMIRPSTNNKFLHHAELAIAILDKGYINNSQLITIKSLGYRE
jgi:hypothetical protein